MDKTYAGARLRQLRENRSMSQSELARLLEISPSYVNQLEHNGRPLTLPILLKLTETFGVDADFFAPQDTARLIADVREVFADDTVGGAVSAAGIDELTTKLPEVAGTLVALHRRYREAVENIATLVAEQGLDRTAAQQPHEQIRDWFYQRRNYVAALDVPAETLATELRLHPGEVRAGLISRLRERHGVRVVSEHLGVDQHRYEARGRVLRLSATLRPGQAAFRLASELALLEAGEVIDRLVAEGNFTDETARRLARTGLANYYAGALILPYRAFLGAAERHRYDIARLCEEFGVGFETICHRLSTLQRPRTRGVPFSFVRVDRAGNISKRQSATGFHFSRVGGSCPLWIVYEAFSAPGRILTQIAELPDGKQYFWIARTVTRATGGHRDPAKTFAIGLGCELRHAHRLVYADGLDLGANAVATPIGMGCKVCERPACPQRAFPAIGKPLRADEHGSSLIPYPPTE
ncbi:short-chain fatty acyl-CoA regulator family protein [Sciscionella marina]|uniref:short-chain fatty acyl-CoA regulator family protein n=1 Tax=Sciscionella marina TaxID=508770 RepID=UPI00036117D9|nr:short-chain fatty acyl-CoA regulator family protein [Sciscionella marina]